MSGCQAVREMLMDVARGASAENLLRAHLNLLRAHLDDCPDCRRRLANERMLSAGLAASAARDVPPARVQAAVLAEFRRAHKQVPIRRPFIKWVALAAAAMILLALFVTTRHSPQKTVTTVAPPPQTPLPVHPAPIAPAAIAKVPKPVKRRHAAKVQPPPPVETQEVATDFFEIPYTEPLRPGERADVFRMQMPRANMAVFGLPVTGGHLDSRITADVLIGEDGVMRAVRFIR
jgi:hypothetical protein